MSTNAGTQRQAAVARNPPQIIWPGYPVSCRRSIAFVLHASRHCHDDQTVGGLLALLGTVHAGLTLNDTGQRLTATPRRARWGATRFPLPWPPLLTPNGQVAARTGLAPRRGSQVLPRGEQARYRLIRLMIALGVAPKPRFRVHGFASRQRPTRWIEQIRERGA